MHTLQRLPPTTNATLFIWSIPGLAYSLFFLIRSSSTSGGRRLFTLFDDAAISKTYARTLATTGELVWFPGAERVEGISNLGWTGVMTLVHLLGLRDSDAALAISIIGIVLLVAHAVLVGQLVLVLAPRHSVLARLATLTTGLTYPLTFWTVRGFETGAIALLSVALVLTALRLPDSLQDYAPARSRSSRRRFILLSITLMTIRIDALVTPIVALIWLLTQGSHARRVAARLLIAILAALSLLTLWRITYYGSPVPNTYFLKVAGAPTRLQLSRGIASAEKLAVLIALAALSVVVASASQPLRRMRLPDATLPGLGFLALVAYSTWVGGDAWEWSGFANRFTTTGIGLATAGCVSVLGPPVQRFILHAASRPRSMAIWATVATVSLVLLVAGRDLVRLAIVSTPLATVVESLLGRGKNATPDDWISWASGTFARPLIAVGVSALVITCVSGGNRRVAAAISFIAASGLLLQASTTPLSPPRLLEAAVNAVHVHDDAMMVSRGTALRQATTDDAVIATVWAGNPAYYAGRAMIDLLGKSDPVIARLEPEITDWRNLYPGHNKWDYAHSIGVLKPDVIFQLWMPTPADLEMISSLGYDEACLGDALVRIRRDSLNLVASSFTSPSITGCPT